MFCLPFQSYPLELIDVLHKVPCSLALYEPQRLYSQNFLPLYALIICVGVPYDKSDEEFFRWTFDNYGAHSLKGS